MILAGEVFIGGKVIDKPSFDLTNEICDVEIRRASKKFASRGGLKLDGALKAFKINTQNKLALDIGASSGGFTDCLLQNGVKHVISVDSGIGQIADFLREDERVTVIEKYNARYMNSEDFEYVPDLAVMDVSFISATYIIPAVYKILAPEGDFICLIKPQFEVGKSLIGKNGVVKSEKARQKAVEKVTSFAMEQGFSVVGVILSSIEGGDGNIEYLAYFRKRG